MQQDRVTLQPLYVDLLALHPLGIHCVREAGILGTDDLDFLGVYKETLKTRTSWTDVIQILREHK